MLGRAQDEPASVPEQTGSAAATEGDSGFDEDDVPF